MSDRIEVLPYNPEWPLIFENIKNQVWPKVQNSALSIEHVGSTSIPGLCAKPVVDIAIIVESPKKVDEAILGLKELGYEHRGDLGIKGREAFKRPQGSPKHNLYVALNDSLSLKNHLFFKNYLLNNENARKQYSDLKLKLAEEHAGNIDLYVAGKTSFIVGILKQQGMSETEIREIEDANKPMQNAHSSADMSQIQSPSLEQKMSKWFLRFAEQAAGSPMYQYLSKRISEDKELLVLAAHSDPNQPAPNLLLASVHFLLMQHPEDQLAKFYPSLNGQFQSNDEFFDSFKNFCIKFASEIQPLLRTKLVQTNEVQRCALLLPAVNLISQMSDQKPIALIDVGSAGGLNLLMDKTYIQYSDGISVGPINSPLQLQCDSQGLKIPEFQDVKIENRIGIDLNPVNLLDANERQWNLALIWPDQIERFDRMKSALKILEKTPITFKKGGGNQVLSDVVSRVPETQTVCIMHSFVLNQFSEEDRSKFDSLLKDLSKNRPIWRISLEWIGSKEPELVVSRYVSGTKNHVQKLAECHGHGEWIRWFNQEGARNV